MPWGRGEFSLDRSDSEEFLGCFFSFAGSPKHQLWAPGRRVCPLACVARVWLGSSVCVAQAVIRDYRPAADLCLASDAATTLP
jgi:hypothetical protein